MCVEFFIDEDVEKLELAIVEAKQNNRSKQFIEKLEEKLRIAEMAAHKVGEEMNTADENNQRYLSGWMR